MSVNRTYILVGLVFLGASSICRADWPVFRGSPQMLGVSTEQLPDQLDEVWTFKTSGSIESAPAVVEGVAYFASTDKFLYALDAKTGKELWRAKLGAPLKASPAVKGGRVYIGDVDGKLFAVDCKTGKTLWTFETQGEIKAGCNFTENAILVGSLDASLYAISTEGQKLWEFKTDGEVHGSPAVGAGKTFLAGCDRTLHILDATTGQGQATIDLAGETAGTIAVAENAAYIGTMTNQVLGLTLTQPKKLWEFEATRRQQPFYSSAAVGEKLIIIGSRDKKVYALDRLTGREVWSMITDGQVDSSPVIVGSKVFAACMSIDGNCYVFDLNSGRKLQELNLDSAVSGSPAIANQCVFIGSEKGTCYCLGQKIPVKR